MKSVAVFSGIVVFNSIDEAVGLGVVVQVTFVVVVRVGVGAAATLRHVVVVRGVVAVVAVAVVL